MKAIRTKNKIKAFAVSVAACLALILSTVFTFGYGGKVIPASADARAAGDKPGIRFVQVAAGSDFAIGLTYDGRLFGWSLDAENNRTTLNVGATSLGGYYIKTPTEIPVKFRVGPGGSALYDWGKNANDYHKETTTVPGNSNKKERIVSIAATSTTAAFITEGGYIYTWGNDTEKDIAGGYTGAGKGTTDYRYLLLRPYSSSDAVNANWYQPYIIDYQYYGNTGLYELIPNGSTYTDVSIAGGENNYIVVFQNFGDKKYCSFVWGSVMYANVQRYGSGYYEKYNFTTDTASDGLAANQGYNVKDASDGYRSLYITQYVPSGASGGAVFIKDGGFVRAVAGGYTVGINSSEVGGASNATSLTLKGKNFITSNDLEYDADTRTVTPAVAVKSATSYTGMLSTTDVTDVDGLSDILFYSTVPKENAYTIEDAIVGGYFSVERTNGKITASTNSTIADLYYARQAAVEIGSGTMVYSVDPVENSGLNGSDGNPLDADKVKASVMLNAVSLGNDIGYGISGGKLYSWGDNVNGQSGKGSDDTTESYQYPERILEGHGAFVSVAAGKQMSPGAAHKAFNDLDTLVFAEDGEVSFSDVVKNDPQYITGAITSDGKLFAWSDTHKDPDEIVFGDKSPDKVSANNRFAAVYSGYGRNLFAITKLGKLVRITCVDGEFVQEVYDYFKEIKSSTTKDGITTYTWGDVVNWTIDAKMKSSVEFTIVDHPTKNDLDPAIGDMTLFIDNALPTRPSIKLDGTLATQVSAEDENEDPEMNIMTYGSAGNTRGSLVSTNAVGDVYRILENTGADAAITYLPTATKPSDAGANAPSNDTLDQAELTPKFYFTAKGTTQPVEMTDKLQWSQMFEYEFVDDPTYGVGIKIKPKRSTQNGTVTVSFYVARYDCSADVTNATYYDHLKCSVDFTIGNSNVVQIYDAYNGDNENKSNIPLLDPSNASNKYYSLAVQDVSSGFTALADFISGNNQSTTNELVNKIVKSVTTRTNASLTAATINWDPGFPDKNKIEAGNLKYYLGGDVDTLWYTGEYKYLFKDRDLDVVKLSNVLPSLNNNSAIAYGAKTVSVRLEGLASGENALTDKIAYTDDFNTRINKHFENIYGLTNIGVIGVEVNGEMYVDVIEFSYDVLLFTANGTTGRLDYGENPTVTSFNTVNDNTKNIVLSYTLQYEEYKTFTTDFTTKLNGLANDDKNRGPNWTHAASVFSQASVRLKDDYRENGNIVYGAAKDNPLLGIVANNHLEIEDNAEHHVGDDPIVIKLSDYITASGSDSFISFSYDNQNGNFTKFDETFVDSVTGAQYITLTKSQITVKLLGAPRINFTVTIQRFWGPQGTGTFGDDERVTISFSITKISPITFGRPNSGNQGSNKFKISREMKLYVFGSAEAPEAERVNVIDSGALVSLARDYRSEMKLTNIMSTDSDVVSARADSDQVLTITPGKSGTAAIMFTLSAFGKSIPITLTFNVAGVTDIKDKNDENKEIDYTVNLSDVQYVYISELTTGLKNAVGSFMTVDDFSVISTDTQTLDDGRTKYVGVEFERVADKDGNKPPMTGYYPEYVQSISFHDMGTDKAYIRFDMDSNANADDLLKEYTVYVKLVDTQNNGYKNYNDAAGDTVLRAAFKLKANKKVAFESGSILEIVADCDNPKKQADSSSNSDWYMGDGTDLEAKIYVPLRFICDKAGITNYNEYEIFLVSASADINDKHDPSTYINPVGGSEATLNVIEITPYKNTSLPITLNVSIRNTQKGASENQVVAFTVSVKGISEYLTKDEYIIIWLVAFFSSLGLLMIIFLIRMIIYWRRRAKQRALIKRNQELIKMRDKVHNKASSATRDQALRTKLKLQDPKYAKMFNDMKKDQNGGVGVATVGDDFGGAEAPTGKKSKKKKGGKKSMAELKAELAAKKVAFAQAQNGVTVEPMTFGAQPVNPFGDMSGDGFGGPAPDFGGPAPDFGAPGPDFGAPGPDFGAPNGAYDPSDLGGNDIIFDAPDIDGQQG